MHPFALLAAAAVALLIYSNFIFYFRPPVPRSAQLDTYPSTEFEKRRIMNLPFFCVGMPATPSHALASRVDELPANARHVVPSEPRCRRILHAQLVGTAREAGVPVVLALGKRAKIKVVLPAGYSLFLPPSWRAQMVVPEYMVCKLYSSDSAGSLCLRLPKLLGPAAERVEEVARSFLADAIAILDTPPERHRLLRPHASGLVRNPDKSVSCTRPEQSEQIVHPVPRHAPHDGHQKSLPQALATNCRAARPSLPETNISGGDNATISV
jgi:hypothetical protein